MKYVNVFLFGLFCTSALTAQTASSGAVSGTVLDPTGAAVTIAAVELTSSATAAIQKQNVNSSGQFVFPSVAPGEYSLKVTAAGFRVAKVEALRVEVTKSYVQDIRLEVGSLVETVEVVADARTELQTVDSTIGSVIPGKALPTMPLFTRTVNELLTVQPGTTPAGEVTGARNDQSTLTLDGIDVTNNSTGGTGSFMYLGVEGIGEFRVSVANPSASFGRGSGGQVSLVSRSGQNKYHGGVFWYHQNDDLNANSWTNNRTRVAKPELKDNRFGFTLGGPAPGLKNKTFFFANYDGRRFPNQSTITRIVPLDSLRNGTLRFRDSAGVTNAYDLRTTAACGAAGDQVCDPRGLGVSPTIAAMWRLMPAANDFSQGDGLNTGGFTASVGVPISFGFYNARIDHRLNTNWTLFGNIRYFRQLAANQGTGTGNSIDIRNGVTNSISKVPTRQNGEILGATGTIRPNLIADLRFGLTRNRAVIDVQRPNVSASLLGLPGTSTSAGPIAIDLGGRGGANNLLSEPFDVDTQVARRQENDNRIYQFNADLNWIKRKHTVQFGFHFRNLPTLHRRDDKVVGSLGSLLAQVDSDLGPLVVSPASAPPPCNAGRTSRCLQAADAQQWNRLFASATGMMDNVSILAVRDGSFKPLPFGSLLESNTVGIHSPEFYVQDIWRLSSSLTVTVGLNYGWQTPPREALGRYTLQTYADSGKVVNADFLDQRRQAATAGSIYNPNFAFVPINSANGASVFNVDWRNLGPRVSVAWNPAGGSGLLGKILGEKRTVVRTGYALIYDRQNTVQSVIVPSLGVGFAQTINVTAPKCNVSGSPGGGCNPTSTNTAANNFRLGVDGTIPVPTVPSQSIPVSPPWGLINGAVVTFPEVLSFQVDPNLKTGRNHAIDFSIQREIRGDMILEVSYVGRYANRLPQGMNLLQAPYTQLDKASGQTFAQAFDNVAAALRAGANAPNQPFFENNVPNGGTQFLVSQVRSNFVNGNVNQVFLSMDRQRMASGQTPFNNYFSQMAMLRSSTGLSNYNGLLATLRKRPSRGLFYELTYTLSKSLDQLGRIQNSANITPNSFDLNAEYGPSEFDIRHIFNTVAGYDLPIKLRTPVLKYITNGWTVSGIFHARSGDALIVTQGAPVWGGGLNLQINSGAIPLVSPSTFSRSTQQTVGANGIGTNAGGAGSGLGLFAEPDKIFNNFRRINVASDTRSGRSIPLRGMPRWNFDSSIAKSTAIGERVRFRIQFDFFNLVNHVDFANPGLDLTNPRAFGVITSQFIPANRTYGSRNIQASARIDF
ncbi:MAG: carboxypeptidase regulatory-like domain-containing protein [Candidatus Solibacter usitatus]|nr:carboxypeptidase regulatory-like domain-containing protein [Candidatus Solibacter usitatus]